MSLEGVFEDIFESFHIDFFFLPEKKKKRKKSFLIKGLSVYGKSCQLSTEILYIFQKINYPKLKYFNQNP